MSGYCFPINKIKMQQDERWTLISVFDVEAATIINWVSAPSSYVDVNKHNKQKYKKTSSKQGLVEVHKKLLLWHSWWLNKNPRAWKVISAFELCL